MQAIHVPFKVRSGLHATIWHSVCMYNERVAARTIRARTNTCPASSSYARTTHMRARVHTRKRERMRGVHSRDRKQHAKKTLPPANGCSAGGERESERPSCWSRTTIDYLAGLTNEPSFPARSMDGLGEKGGFRPDGRTDVAFAKHPALYL